MQPLQTIYDVQLQKTIALRDWVAKHNRTTCKNVGKTTPELAVPQRGRSDHDPGLNKRVPHPSAGQASHPSPETRFVLQNTTFRASANFQKRISCETSLQKWKVKMWKRSFRARPPSKSESGRCETEAFVQDSPQNLKVEDVRLWDFPQKVKLGDAKKKLSCQISFFFVIVVMLWLWWCCDSGDVVIVVILLW